MSSGASHVAVLGARGNVVVPSAPVATRSSSTRLITFSALALYGTLNWSTLVIGHPLNRLLGLWLLAVVLAAGRPLLARRSRLLAAAATIVVLIAVFAIAGVPLAWIWHVRIAVTANAIGDGLSALPQVLVPYSGINPLVDLVMTLGAAVLLFDAALLVAFAPGAMTTLRRAGAALPLVAMAAVPTTIVRPALPYVDGAILFILLVAFVWGEEIGRRRAGGALGVGAIAVVAAMFAAPAVEQHQPWINYRTLAGGLAPKFVDGFDWSQSYGRIDWPRSGRVVLEIKAARPEYWKAENLDVFNGVGWVEQMVPGQIPSPAASATARWTQTIQVTINDMRISEVIGAGVSQQPVGVSESLNDGVSAGTWTTTPDMGPGDAYDVKVYDPDPSPAQLSAAGANYSGLPAGYRMIELPPTNGAPSPDENYYPEETSNRFDSARGYQPQLVFPAFHSGGTITASGGPAGLSGAALIAGSDHYARVYRLAQSLAAGAATPYQFAEAVKNYLSQGFTYSESPPSSAYPLSTFLFSSRLGYCQQFAGAMALLLRMGGVPARVAVGFTGGRKDKTTGLWQVTDYDAHAWVEVWFPHYGWVTFDPTPPADPAISNRSPVSNSSGTGLGAAGGGLSASKTIRGANAGKKRLASQSAGATRRHAGAGSEVPWIVAAGVLVLLALTVLATKPLRSAEAMVAELETALNRMGRPLAGGATLSSIERRVEGSPAAGAYVRALRLARFRGTERLPTAAERRALRRQLRLGLGPLGAVRSLWALPPRWGRLDLRRTRGRGPSQTRAPGPAGA